MTGAVAREVERLFEQGTLTGLSEGELLDRFTARGDSRAFEAIVSRHGPMVLNVCRRVLRDEHAAEDAFQATFLILVRRARSIRGRDRNILGPWLHRTAFRVALRSAKAARKRQSRERSEPIMVQLEQASASQSPDHDLASAIHQELDRLPDKYRLPLVLCCMEGRTHEEAAALLKRPVGSIKGWLARGKERLRARLKRGGVGLSAIAVSTLLANESRAIVPDVLVQKTATAGGILASGKLAATAGVVSASVLSLVEEGVRAMILNKLKAVGVCVLALGLVATGAGVWAGAGRQASGAAKQEQKDAAKPVPAQKTLDGEWILTSYLMQGADMLSEFQGAKGSGQLRIAGSTWTMTVTHGDQSRSTTYDAKFVDDAAQFRSVDLRDERNIVFRGIYSLDGDVLNLAYTDNPDSPRPKEFKSRKDGARVLLQTFRRDAFKSDLERIQGVWAADFLEVGGIEGLRQIRVKVAGNNLTIVSVDRRGAESKTKHVIDGLDEIATPKTIDLQQEQPTGLVRPLYGIYEIDRATTRWSICLAQENGQARPKRLTSKDGKDSYVLMSLIRMPPNPEEELDQALTNLGWAKAAAGGDAGGSEPHRVQQPAETKEQAAAREDEAVKNDSKKADAELLEVELASLKERITKLLGQIASDELKNPDSFDVVPGGTSRSANHNSPERLAALKEVEAIKNQRERLATFRGSRLKHLRAEFKEKSLELGKLKREISRFESGADSVPAARNRRGGSSTGRIQPGDTLRIEVLEALPGRPLIGLRIVRPDGTISLHYYGDLQVAGLTRMEIKIKLIEHLQKFLSDEVLGLIHDDANGRQQRVMPADSDRVFVDEAPILNDEPDRHKPR